MIAKLYCYSCRIPIWILNFMNKIQITLTSFEANGNICPLPLLCWLLKPHFWWIPEVWLCMSCSFLILRVHVSQSQYDKNLSLFMWDMCMLSWLVRWIGWPFESDICNQSPVKVLDFFREDPFTEGSCLMRLLGPGKICISQKSHKANFYLMVALKK